MTHASGFSTYDYVQRWMVSQSKQLAGAEISQGSCDSHLNPRGETVNAELEKNNFKVAENILCQITEELVLDGKPVTAEYVENESIEKDEYDAHWVFKHYRISQYMLQVIRYNSLPSLKNENSMI